MRKKIASALLYSLVWGILFSIVPSAPTAAAGGDSEQLLSFLDTFFSREDVAREAGAIAVSVVKDGQIQVEKGYGVTDISANHKTDPVQTTFRIASVSKVFTAIGLLRLVERGEISLSDSVEKFLGGYRLNNPFESPVTIGMLLAHTTGFEPREPTQDNLLLDSSEEPIGLEEAVFSNFPRVIRTPGVSYMYDNFASELQGYIIEKVSGESFNEYMKKYVFEPIGMTSSSFIQSEDLLNRLPVAYDDAGAVVPVYRLSPSVIPEGSMISTARDMSRFMIAFLNGGIASNGNSILFSASLKLMSTFQMSINEDVPDSTYGFEAPPLNEANGYHVISKDGSVSGFSSLLWLLPDQQTGVFVTYNTNSNLKLKFFSEFMDRFYPGESKFGKADYKTQSYSGLAKFEGVYQNLRTGQLSGIQANIDGTLTVGDRFGKHQILKQVGDMLFVNEAGRPMAFKADEEGNVSFMKYSPQGSSYAVKSPKAPGFPNVPVDHPYAKYIFNLQSLGILKDDPSVPFGLTDFVSREQFVHEILHEFNIPISTTASVFNDLSTSPYKAEIQTAADLGLVNGTGQGRFYPERPMKREEMAIVIQRLLILSGFRASESNTILVQGTSKWAEPAVRMMVDLKIYGPEVTRFDGKVDYGPQNKLTKQELAAIMYLLILPEVPILE